MYHETKYLIIGAGVTGLSFANFINDDYVILEKEDEPGGFCRTIYNRDYIWDYAGHFFHFANIELKEFFNERMKFDEFILKDKVTKIRYKNKYIDYPFQKNIHQLAKNEFIDCLYDLFNKNETEYSTFIDMLYAKFGKSITEKFLKPYNEKLYACDLSDLDADAMGRFFPYANLKEIINNMKEKVDKSYNKEFLYPKKGAVAYIKTLQNGINPGNILFNQEVIKIDKEKNIAYTNSSSFKYQYLINTAPLLDLIKYIDEAEYLYAKTLLTFNKVLVINCGFNKKSKIRNIHWVYVPDKNINFYRYGFYDNILDTEKLSLYIEIGFSADESIDMEHQLDLSIKNLRKLGVIDDSHELIAYKSIIMNPAYVHISSKGNAYKSFLKEKYNAENIFTIGRYGDWKYCSIEDSIHDALILSKELKSL